MADQDPRRVTLYPRGGGEPIVVGREQSVRLLANGWSTKQPNPPAADKPATTPAKGDK
jgi:hypothetical protein